MYADDLLNHCAKNLRSEIFTPRALTNMLADPALKAQRFPEGLVHRRLSPATARTARPRQASRAQERKDRRAEDFFGDYVEAAAAGGGARCFLP